MSDVKELERGSPPPVLYTKSDLIHGNSLRQKPKMVKIGTSLPWGSVERLKRLAAMEGEDMNQILACGIDLMWEARKAPE